MKAHWYNQNKLKVYKLTVDKIKEYLPDQDKIRLLDVGCGYGHIAQELSKDKRLEIFAVDKDIDCINEATKRLLKYGGLTSHLHGENLPFPNGYLDVVISTGYACAASNPLVLKEIQRVLKSNGTLIMDFQNYNNLYTLLKGNWNKFNKTTIYKIRNYLIDFNVIRHDYIYHPLPWLSRIIIVKAIKTN